jgi:hypothetical protein
LTDPRVQTPSGNAARLRTAFLSVPTDPSAVKDAVCAYVDEMKRLGAAVERIIVDIKRMADLEGGPVHRAMSDKIRGDYAAARKLTEDAIKWCINHYYGTDAS